MLPPMSTPLYAMRVVEVAGDTVRIEMVSTCEAGCFTESNLFAVAAIYEPLHEIVYSRPGVRWPQAVQGPLRSLFDLEELIEWGGGGVPPQEVPRLGIVREVAYEGLRHGPRGSGDVATLRVRVSDPTLVAHLAPGMLWDSYTFDDEGEMLG